MRELIDIHGASGAVYRFSLFREGHPLSPMGGNFLYVREKAGGWEIVHAGEGQNLLTDARLSWDAAVEKHGATHLFTRLNISERLRKEEHADIMRAMSAPQEANPPAAAEKKVAPPAGRPAGEVREAADRGSLEGA